MKKKYEFSGETKDSYGIQLKRIKALVDIPAWGVKAGDLGGWLQSESNLSHAGNAWVAENARVFGNAQVLGNARVLGNAQVYGAARVLGNALVSENALVCGDAWVSGNAKVHENAAVSGNTWVFGDARVAGNTHVCGVAVVQAGAVTKDSDLVVVQMQPYNLTFTPGFITIGDECRTAAEWLKTTPQQALHMGGLPKSVYSVYKAIIKAVLLSFNSLNGLAYQEAHCATNKTKGVFQMYPDNIVRLMRKIVIRGKRQLNKTWSRVWAVGESLYTSDGSVLLRVSAKHKHVSYDQPTAYAPMVGVKNSLYRLKDQSQPATDFDGKYAALMDAHQHRNVRFMLQDSTQTQAEKTTAITSSNGHVVVFHNQDMELVNTLAQYGRIIVSCVVGFDPVLLTTIDYRVGMWVYPAQATVLNNKEAMSHN